jgi:hypothetical protein
MGSKYIGGKNLGRRISVCTNALLYDLTGRSEGSRDRVIAEVHGGDYEVALWVLSRKPLPPKESAILEYPCMIKVKGRKPDTFVIGNGVQTKDVAKALVELGKAVTPEKFPIVLEEALQYHGVEPDAPNYTPRIAGIVQMYEDEKLRGFEHACLGTIYRDDEKGKQRDDKLPRGTVKTQDIKPFLGVFNGVSTYTANGGECVSAHGDTMSFKCPKFGEFEDSLYMTVAPAQALAEFEYEQLQQFFVEEATLGIVDTRVATAAIVPLKPLGFSIGIKNRHTVRQEA